MRKPLFLGLFVLATLNGCVTIPNTTACTVAGVLAAGSICSETQTNVTYDMTLDETIDFLEPQLERPDPKNPGKILPARAGAVCQSASDWNKNKTALEVACRELGKRCSYEMKAAIKRMTR